MAAASGSRVVVLGSSGAWPEPDGACSGFVIEHAGYRVVLDLGYGTLPGLLSHLGGVNADGIDAVVVSHHHPDHCIDVHGLFHARWFGRRGEPPIPLYAPRGVLDVILGLEADDDRDDVFEMFDWHELPAEPYDLGPFRLDSWALPHYVPNAGVRLAADDLVVAYTGDTGPSPALVELARDADLLIAQASEPTKSSTGSGSNYLAADEAAGVAATANVKRLLLSHFRPGTQRAPYAAAAREHFTGEILIAEKGLVLDLR